MEQNDINIEILKQSKALYVEDDIQLSKLMSKELSKYFGEFVNANDGLEALELFNTKDFDVLITDINMPRLGGMELIKEIRGGKKEISIFIVSAYDYSDFAFQALELKIDGYIVKPVKPTMLLEKISETLRIKSILKEHENLAIRLDSITQAMGEGLATIDGDGNISFVNRQFLELFGETRENVIGKNILDVKARYCSANEKPYSEILDTLRDGISRERVESIRNKKGDILYLKIKTSIIKKDDGSFDESCKVVGVFTDITEHRHFEDALFESRAHYRAVVDDTPFLLCRFKKGGIIEFVNRGYAEYFGKTPSELVGRSFFELLPPEAIESVKQKIDSLNKENPITSMIHLVVDKNGEKRWQRWTDRAIFNQEGELESYQSIGEDITDIKKTEDELKEKERMMFAQSKNAAMGEMVGMIAHQWRQPISAIGMAINNLKADIALGMFDQNEALKRYDDISNLVDFLSKTIDDFRDFFREEREKESVSIDDVIKDSLKIIGKSLENNYIKVELELHGERPIAIFRREMMQVFLNIIKNSKDAILENKIENGFVRINSGVEGDSVIIEITDNGGGVSEEVLGRIFEPYFTTKNPTFGTGLGLHMTKTIIEQHHKGEITAKRVEHGLSFKIKLKVV